ncbi:MAG: hypothetical protein ACREDP_21305 [Bradyrhizobium sp.]
MSYQINQQTVGDLAFIAAPNVDLDGLPGWCEDGAAIADHSPAAPDRIGNRTSLASEPVPAPAPSKALTGDGAGMIVLKDLRRDEFTSERFQTYRAIRSEK